jgi:hypothetical protein
MDAVELHYSRRFSPIVCAAVCVTARAFLRRAISFVQIYAFFNEQKPFSRRFFKDARFMIGLCINFISVVATQRGDIKHHFSNRQRNICLPPISHY